MKQATKRTGSSLSTAVEMMKKKHQTEMWSAVVVLEVVAFGGG